jgi:YfiH family protein
MWIKAPNISVKHGFSTRHGGISPAPFDSLNLAGSDDEPKNIEANRVIALNELGIIPAQIANLKQIHGCDVVRAKPGTFTGDALVTNEKGIAIAVAAADCYPLIFHDPINHVIGAAHAGWRGTVARIAAQTIEQMLEMGAKKEDIQMAIGPGICKDHFEVGNEVHDKFLSEGFPQNIIHGKNIDLVKANEFAALEMGIKKENIWAMHRCTFENDFFSYRRDGGKTGRMWGVIVL